MPFSNKVSLFGVVLVLISTLIGVAHCEQGTWTAVSTESGPNIPLFNLYADFLNEDEVVLIGGRDNISTATNDIWKYNINTQTWSFFDIPSLPTMFYHRGLVLNSSFVMFGGQTTPALNGSSLIMLDGSLKKSATILNPSPPVSQFPRKMGLTIVQFTEFIVVIGGLDFNRILSSPVVFAMRSNNLTSWTPVQLTKETVPPKAGHTALVIDDFIWVYGGAEAFNVFQTGPQICMQTDQRVYSLKVFSNSPQSPIQGFWLERPFNGRALPVGRAFHSAVQNPNTGEMLVFGGLTESCGVLSDMWAFDTKAFAWSQVTTTPNLASSSHVALFDRKRVQMMIFGVQTTPNGFIPFTGNPVSVVPSVQLFQFTQPSATTTGTSAVDFFFAHEAFIIGGIGGAALLLFIVIVAIIALIHRRQKNKKKDLMNKPLLEGNTGTQYKSVPAPTSSSSFVPGKYLDLFNACRIESSELTIGKEVGGGISGTVFEGVWRGAAVAVKTLKQEASLFSAWEDFLKEASHMRKLSNHSNVVSFYGILVQNKMISIVTEYCDGGSLYRLLRTDFKMSERIITKILKGICAGMIHLHAQNFVHRDLAARNILLTKSLDAKISDFGLSRFLTQPHASNTQITDSHVMPLKHSAPESLLKREYSKKSDIWSYGVVIYEVLTRKEPYGEMSPLQASIHVANDHIQLSLPKEQEDLYPNLANLMGMCMQRDPEKRPFFDEILKHDSFNPKLVPSSSIISS